MRYMCSVIMQVSPTTKYPILSHSSANFTVQLSHILTNNLNVKALVGLIYVCMMTQLCFTHLHLFFKKIDIFFWTLWGENSFYNFVIYFWTNSLYTISNLTPYGKTFGLINIYWIGQNNRLYEGLSPLIHYNVVSHTCNVEEKF